jgi:hypothetical protein
MKASKEQSNLKSFRRRTRLRRKCLDERYGREMTDRVVEEADKEYSSLLSEIDALPKGMMNGALAGTYEYLAYAKALAREGRSAEEIGLFFDESYDVLVSRFPRFLGPLVFRLARPLIKARLRKEAAQSQALPETEGGWRFEFLEAEKGSHDFGFDVKSCAVCELFSKHDAEEVVPYLCALDDKMSELMGMGLRRSGTRALGASCCDFRYQAGAEPRPLRSEAALSVVD